MHTYIDDPRQRTTAKNSTSSNDLLWFAGAIGTAIGIAAWAYSRREISYWERTRRTASQVAETAAEMNPWLGVGAATAALGSAALAYRLSHPKSSWQKATERGEEFLSQTGKQLRPWLGAIASAALSVASATYNAKSRRRVAATVTDKTADAAEHFADAASRIWRRLRTISAETSKLYPQARKMLA